MNNHQQLILETMKKIYRLLSIGTVCSLLIAGQFSAAAQAKAKETKVRPNAATSHNYWSIGAFGGVMQFNGDLSRNLLYNLYPDNFGYTFGLTATKQFSRVIGVRVRMAYGLVQSKVEGKYVWDYEGGNGTQKYIYQKFRSRVFETNFELTVNWLNWILGCKPERVFSSYLFAGFGMDQSTGTKTDIILNKETAYLGKKGNDLNVGNNRGISGMDFRLKLSAGIGFDININKQFSIPIEFSWKLQNSDLLDMTIGGSREIFNDMYSSATIGLTYKFGYTGGCNKFTDTVQAIPPLAAADYPVKFSVYAPKNIPAERSVREIFPLRNYVFFNLESTEIPDRYVLLTKNQVKDFKEDNLERFPPKNLTGRSGRQMVIYYNVLNILGDRMGKIPSSTIKLVGSTEKGPEEGKAMAGSVKDYLVNVFGIAPSRISVEGRDKPKIPSEQPGGKNELDLLRSGDRRVSIESSSADLLLEFQSGGPDVPLRPVEFKIVQAAPVDSYVTFDAVGANNAFTSWSLEIADPSGSVQNFGPYTSEEVMLPGKTILGTLPEANFKVTMVGQARAGMIVKKDTTVHMVLWNPPADKEGTRFSIIYEFNDSKAISMYEKYITDILLPRIPKEGLVLISGYTDNIGEEAYNRKLSMARANDVKAIMEKGLAAAGRTDVRFRIFGFGEDQAMSPFENTYPEERFYNRTVIIDILPSETI